MLYAALAAFARMTQMMSGRSAVACLFALVVVNKAPVNGLEIRKTLQNLDSPLGLRHARAERVPFQQQVAQLRASC